MVSDTIRGIVQPVALTAFGFDHSGTARDFAAAHDGLYLDRRTVAPYYWLVSTYIDLSDFRFIVLVASEVA